MKLPMTAHAYAPVLVNGKVCCDYCEQDKDHPAHRLPPGTETTYRLKLRLPRPIKAFREVWRTSTLHNISRKARTQRYMERCALRGVHL